MNYIGGKYKLLNQILPLFPKDISMFYDVFGGGGSLSLNVNSDFVYYNDIVCYVSNMFEAIKGENEEERVLSKGEYPFVHIVFRRPEEHIKNEEGTGNCKVRSVPLQRHSFNRSKQG